MTDAKYKNYLDHEISVRFVDGILEQNQDWQWFIDYIEENYNLSDANSYIEFQNRSNSLIRILRNFINILEVGDSEFKFKTILLKDIYLISKYYVGAIEREKCAEKVNTEFSKILFLSVWLTKLQNSANNSKYIIDNRFLSQRNFHQALNMQEFDYHKEKIILYLKEIKLEGFEIIKQNVEDNLNRVVYDLSENFFEIYGDNLLSVNCFNYQSIEKSSSLTWQENTLLDLLQISITNGKIVPLFSSGDGIVSNYNSWSPDLLEQLKNYFNHQISNFVIESVDFLINRKDPSLATVETHCNLFVELISNGEDYEILTSSTYEILTMLFNKGVMDRIEKTEVIINFYKTLHSINSINLLMSFQFSLPISKDQIRIVKDYIENQYRGILDISDIPTLTQYLENTDIARHINQLYYEETKNKFLRLIEGKNDALVANLFYQAMLFLLSVNQTNLIVDKRIVKQDMIYLQEYWQLNIYKEQVDNLQEFVYKTEIPAEEVENYNTRVIENPIFLASDSIITKVEDMISVMEVESKNALIHLVSKINISHIFPIKDVGVNFERHETDNLLKSQVEKILNKYGYKFLNLLDVEKYVSALHQRYIKKLTFAVSVFNREKELYALVEEHSGVTLIPYENNISLGHLTQLFPLLEIEIRNLGKLFGIFPFKENLDEFMKFKDPSSILRELIDNVYQELDGFENIPDLLFIYHFMYNSNSLNIRNECIHGREYIEGNQLKFGFKITLLALSMLIYRKNLILANISKK